MEGRALSPGVLLGNHLIDGRAQVMSSLTVFSSEQRR